MFSSKVSSEELVLRSLRASPMPSRRMSNILTYQVRVALATSDVHNMLEIPATDEIHMEDRNHGLA